MIIAAEEIQGHAGFLPSGSLGLNKICAFLREEKSAVAEVIEGGAGHRRR